MVSVSLTWCLLHMNFANLNLGYKLSHPQLTPNQVTRILIKDYLLSFNYFRHVILLECEVEKCCKVYYQKAVVLLQRYVILVLSHVTRTKLFIKLKKVVSLSYRSNWGFFAHPIHYCYMAISHQLSICTTVTPKWVLLFDLRLLENNFYLNSADERQWII